MLKSDKDDTLKMIQSDRDKTIISLMNIDARIPKKVLVKRI